VYTILSWISNITDVVDVFNQKPFDDSLPTDPFLYTRKISDVVGTSSNVWYMQKLARIELTIFSKAVLWVGEDHETILFDIMDVIKEEIVGEWCNKIAEWDGTFIWEISEDTESPILYDQKERPYIKKDFLFTYFGLNG